MSTQLLQAVAMFPPNTPPLASQTESNLTKALRAHLLLVLSRCRCSFLSFSGLLLIPHSSGLPFHLFLHPAIICPFFLISFRFTFLKSKRKCGNCTFAKSNNTLLICVCFWPSFIKMYPWYLRNQATDAPK